MYENFKFIPENLIERGSVKKCVVTSLEEFESIFPNDSMKEYVSKFMEQGCVIEALLLAPFASVKQHIHSEMWEIRINVKTRKWDVVEIGGIHERLKNNTNKEQLYICIKGKAQIPIPNIKDILKEKN